MSAKIDQLTGYPRKNGRWGFRNYILILPLHNALNQLSEEMRVQHPAHPVLTTVAHDWSGEIDDDWERIERTFSGFAVNPNVGATIFIGVGSPTEELIVNAARSKREMPIAYLTLRDSGGFDNLRQLTMESISEVFPLVASEKERAHRGAQWC